jgi:hypothetical protein
MDDNEFGDGYSEVGIVSMSDLDFNSSIQIVGCSLDEDFLNLFAPGI